MTTKRGGLLEHKTRSGIIETDSTPTNIVVKIDPVASGDIAELAYVACKEVSLSDRLTRNDDCGIAVRATSSSATFGTVASELTASVVVPCPNCRIRVTVNVGVQSLSSVDGKMTMTLSENIDSVGASAKASSEVSWSRYDPDGGPVHIDYINTAPTVGGVHAYTIALSSVNGATTRLGDYHWMQVEVITP